MAPGAATANADARPLPAANDKSSVSSRPVSTSENGQQERQQHSLAGAGSFGDEIDAEKPRLTFRTVLAILSVTLIYFAQLVSLVGAGAQGQIIALHFDDPSKVIWFTAPITILTVVLGPIVSHAADFWGRKVFLVPLTLCGAVGSVVVARASSMAMAVAGFSVVGLAFGVQPLLHTVTSEVLPRRWRGHGQAVDMVSNALGSICGLLVGGALNRTGDPASDGFRYYFYMATAWYVLGALLCLVGYSPPPTGKQLEFRRRSAGGVARTLGKLARLDWVGYLLLAAGLVLFCLGLSWSRNPYPWSDPHVSATFAVGLVLALALVAYETRARKDGMFHHGLFAGNRNFAVATLCVFAEGVAFFAANTYFAFEVGVLYEHDALLVGVRYSLMLVACMVGALACGLYCAVFRRVRWVTVLSFLVFVAFFAAMATANRDTNAPVWGYPILLGLALGGTLTTLVTVAQLSTPPELISIASGLVIAVRSLGGTIGIAVYNALFSDQMSRLAGNVAEAATAAGLPPESVEPLVAALSAHNETALRAVPGATEAAITAGTNAYLDTYVLGFRYVWIAAAAFVALAAVAAAFLHDPKGEFNMHVDAPMDDGEEE